MRKLYDRVWQVLYLSYARKHAAFMARIANLTSDSPSAAAAFKAAIRSYRASEQSAKDLISIFYSRLNDDLEATSSLIVPLIDMLDDNEKKKDLLETFNGFKTEVFSPSYCVLDPVYLSFRVASATVP